MGLGVLLVLLGVPHRSHPLTQRLLSKPAVETALPPEIGLLTTAGAPYCFCPMKVTLPVDRSTLRTTATWPGPHFSPKMRRSPNCGARGSPLGIRVSGTLRRGATSYMFCADPFHPAASHAL